MFTAGAHIGQADTFILFIYIYIYTCFVHVIYIHALIDTIINTKLFIIFTGCMRCFSQFPMYFLLKHSFHVRFMLAA